MFQLQFVNAIFMLLVFLCNIYVAGAYSQPADRRFPPEDACMLAIARQSLFTADDENVRKSLKLDDGCVSAQLLSCRSSWSH